MIEHRDGRFFQNAGAHIDLSNTQLQNAVPSQVVAAMIHATARFSAWAWAVPSTSAEHFESQRQLAIDTFVADCRRQFEEHFNDHSRNFDRLLNREKDAG